MRQAEGARRTAGMLVVVGVAALAAGCGGAAMDGATDGPGEALVGRVFLSESVTEDGTAVDLVAGTRISLEFTAGGEVVTAAGCNTLRGTVSIGADTLAVSAVGGTEMGCDQPRHDQDRWLAEFLESSPAWALAGDRLTLTAGPTRMVLLDRRVADPDRPLAGTRWLVDTVVTGETASSLVAGTEGAAWLLIEGGGFTASSGCREFTGRADHDPDRIRFSETVQTDPACPPELAALDEVMRTVLSGEVRYAVTAARLSLEHPDGVGLGLGAG